MKSRRTRETAPRPYYERPETEWPKRAAERDEVAKLLFRCDAKVVVEVTEAVRLRGDNWLNRQPRCFFWFDMGTVSRDPAFRPTHCAGTMEAEAVLLSST